MDTHIAIGGLEASPEEQEVLVGLCRLFDRAAGLGSARLALLGRGIWLGDLVRGFLRRHGSVGRMVSMREKW